MEGEARPLRPVKVTKVTSNDGWPLVYLPKKAVELLGLRKGTEVIMLVDEESKALVIKPIA